MSERMTAVQAREIAGPTIEERVDAAVDAALIDIRAAAEKKRRQISLHADLWTHGGYSSTDEYTRACEVLRGLGYTVEFFYEELQFVNMYTVVKW